MRLQVCAAIECSVCASALTLSVSTAHMTNGSLGIPGFVVMNGLAEFEDWAAKKAAT
jgi:hypothetical protein